MKSNITLLKMSSGYRKNLRYFIFQDNKKVLCIMVTFVMFLFIVFPERKRIGPTLTVNSNINAMPSSVLNSTPNKIGQNPGSEIQSDMKYILLWTDAKASPFIYMGKGQSTFSNRKCKWTNCYVTDDRNYLGHYSEFEVIAFNGPQLVDALFINDLPTTRSSRQKYVYANIESAENYPINTFFFNGFFNWTWTYKLNSDALWGYFVVRNATKHSVAPSVDVHWKTLKEMEPIGDELKNKLNRKSIAVAGYITNCYTSNHREKYISALRKQMDRLNLQIDVYGKCGTLECPKKIMTRCLKYLENNYFFYLAFENSCSDDYVTEKVVSALQYSTVPIVYSGANYSRFLPPGSYLDASQTNPKHLASEIAKIIEDPEKYYDFFRWKKYYSIHHRHAASNTDDYCHFCEMINNKNLMETKTVNKHFNSWWKNRVTCYSKIFN